MAEIPLNLQRKIYHCLEKGNYKEFIKLHKENNFDVNFRFDKAIDEAEFSLVHQLIDDACSGSEKILEYLLKLPRFNENLNFHNLLNGHPPIHMCLWRGEDVLATLILEKRLKTINLDIIADPDESPADFKKMILENCTSKRRKKHFLSYIKKQKKLKNKEHFIKNCKEN